MDIHLESTKLRASTKSSWLRRVYGSLLSESVGSLFIIIIIITAWVGVVMEGVPGAPGVHEMGADLEGCRS
ncbi:hypothetical protein INR49_001063 [Caranx melampygus]|nr:hypothetical protein INR49_001063 [Caranx melampygus]